MLGYAPVGVAFGVLAVTSGYAVPGGPVFGNRPRGGGTVHRACRSCAGGGSLSAALVATAVVNLRYVLFASTISPYLHGRSPARQAPLAFTLTDETFAVNIADRRAGLATPASMLGVGAVAWLGWVAGTAVGACGAGCGRRPDAVGRRSSRCPRCSPRCSSRSPRIAGTSSIGVLAGALAVGLAAALARRACVIDASWFVVIAAMVAATVGSVVFR